MSTPVTNVNCTRSTTDETGNRSVVNRIGGNCHVTDGDGSGLIEDDATNYVIDFDGFAHIHFHSENALYATFVVISVLALVGNGVVLIFLLKGQRKSLSSITERLLRNQCIADLMTSLTLLLLTLDFVPASLDKSWWWSEIVCRLFYNRLLLTIFFSTSVYNLVAITFEQYLQIVHPIFHRTRLGWLGARHYAAVVWVIGVSLNTLLWIPISGIVENACDEFDVFPSENVRDFCGILSVTVYYLLPLVTIVYCFTLSVTSLHRKRNRVGPMGRSPVFRQTKIRIMKTMALFCGVFLLCWSPNSIILLLSFFHVFNVAFPAGFYNFTVVLFYGCCAINPLLFATRHRKFKDSFVGTITSCCRLFHCHCRLIGRPSTRPTNAVFIINNCTRTAE
jgi:hypothetical protein